MRFPAQLQTGAKLLTLLADEITRLETINKQLVEALKVSNAFIEIVNGYNYYTWHEDLDQIIECNKTAIAATERKDGK